MIKLYTKPGACSSAVDIVLAWSGLPHDVAVLTATQMKEPAFLAVNPAGAVPVIVDGDFTLTQNAAIMGYIAESAPDAGLWGDGSARQRAEVMRWLAFVNSDLHPAFKPIFSPASFLPDATQADALKAAAQVRIAKLLESAEQRLGQAQWLAGFRSPADAYLYIVLRWAVASKIDFGQFPHLVAFMQRMEADNGVQQVFEVEKLKPMAPGI